MVVDVAVVQEVSILLALAQVAAKKEAKQQQADKRAKQAAQRKAKRAAADAKKKASRNKKQKQLLQQKEVRQPRQHLDLDITEVANCGTHVVCLVRGVGIDAQEREADKKRKAQQLADAKEQRRIEREGEHKLASERRRLAIKMDFFEKRVARKRQTMPFPIDDLELHKDPLLVVKRPSRPK